MKYKVLCLPKIYPYIVFIWHYSSFLSFIIARVDVLCINGLHVGCNQILIRTHGRRKCYYGENDK